MATMDIVGGARLPVGPIKLSISYSGSGNATFGISGNKGLGERLQGTATYNTSTDTWSANFGVGDFVGDYSSFAGKKGGFAGIGIDANGAYFVLRGGATFPAGTLPITPYFTSITYTTKFDIGTWEEIGDSLAGAADYANGVAQDLANDISDAINNAINAFLNALGIASPIVLDLDGDGLELISLSNSKTYFDIDNDLFAERTGWVKGDDGFLARDLNGNGKIDNQGELFGDNGGSSAYSKLALLDSNNDGKISSMDSSFASLRIWQDSSQNGYADSGELKTLAAAGIASLNKAYTASTATNQGHFLFIAPPFFSAIPVEYS